MNCERIKVTQKMYETGIVPVFHHHDIDVCKSIVSCCYDAGIRVFEFTNRGINAQEVFIELHKYARHNFKDLILGAGTIMDAATAATYIQYGANFIVSPIVDQHMAKTCNRRKVAWIPGCSTINEISVAEELGAEVVKLFPASMAGGADFIKMIKGPMPWTSIMATGGIDAEISVIEKWFRAGVHCVGLGSQLFVKDNEGNFKLPIIKAKIEEITFYINALKRD
ncbi:bifunctional 4-hydroxy-2-oxoglutarate aldolase/2-dehydro-3-deoxy-phosphogluconate aldolase [Galbibacter sp. PAP.153]|uniref:bifunctional 4-hydroxy-2-oxoglutarate aldolase/2-dehydro-3-deoxy-phosphogluconate aldolase n=1 Tax=Galbibacter sp. PAP.153 TaxID=3104623 RepID=UPI00300AB3B8